MVKLGLILALHVEVRCDVMEVHGTGASPRADGDGGGAEQAGPGMKRTGQLHTAGAVLRKESIYSDPSFSSTFNGLCTGHRTRNLTQRRHEHKYTSTRDPQSQICHRRSQI